MPVTIQQNRKRVDNDNIGSILSNGMQYTYKNTVEIEDVRTATSGVVTIDLGSQLFREIIDWKEDSINPLDVQVLEVQDWERIIKKLNALDDVFGMLNGLTPEQSEAFEKAVKRRPLFE